MRSKSHLLHYSFVLNCQKDLHMNAGTAGTHGFHQVRTMLRFTIDGSKIDNLEVIEFKK